jgi:hypothetical protein
MSTKLNNHSIVEFSDDFGNVLNIKLYPDDVLNNWNFIGTVADNIYNYYKASFETEINKELVFMALNELVENGVKFSKFGSKYISIDSYKLNDRLYIKVTNDVSIERFDEMRKIKDELETKDLKEIFIKRIKGLRENISSHGIGLVLLKKNPHYKMNISFKDNGFGALQISISIEIDFNIHNTPA